MAPLLQLLPQHPKAFFNRVVTIVELRLEGLFRTRPSYSAVSWESAIQDLDIAHIVAEPALKDIEDSVRLRLETVRYETPFSFRYNADIALARCCYAICRLLKPAIILETGVAHGVTSAFLLRALEENNYGMLHSLELPFGKGVDRFVGVAVPEDSKQRWELHKGINRRVLPELLRKIGSVDVFVHDSGETYRNLQWEFSTVLPYLRPGGAIIANDIEGNQAFEELQQLSMRLWLPIEKAGGQRLFGVAIRS